MSVSADHFLLREPKQQRSRDLLDKLREATVVVAKDTGLRNLTTNHVAEEAKVDISSVYRFFPDKLALIGYTMDHLYADIRTVWDRYESEEAVLCLDWRDYFQAISNDWQSESVGDYYTALDKAEMMYPELRDIEDRHLQYYVAFFVRQMKRFGAKGKKQDWENLAIYLYMIEDEIFSLRYRLSFSSLESSRALFLETMFFHIGKYLK